MTYDMLSNHCKKNTNKYNIKVNGVKNLVPTLGKKANYNVHYMYLQLYLSLRTKLIKIHKILKFKPSDWMKKYVDFNTEKKKTMQEMNLKKKFVQTNE